MLRDLGDKVPSSDKLAIENAISDVKSAIESNDISRINSASDALQQASYKLSQMLYEQAAQAGQPAGSPTGGAEERKPEDEGVIDAEFKAE